MLRTLQTKYLFRKFREKSRRVVATTNNYIYSPYQTLHTFVSGSQRSLIRLTHPYPHFDVDVVNCFIYIYYCTWEFMGVVYVYYRRFYKK